MRLLVDGKIRWGFWPPDSGLDRAGMGIWLEGTGVEDEKKEFQIGTDGSSSEKGCSGTDSGEDINGTDEAGQEEEEEEEGEEEEEEEEEVLAEKGKVGGFFAALDLDSDKNGREGGSDEAEEGAER